MKHIVELPKYIDVLLILDDKATKAKIYKILDRSKDYLTNALRYLKAKELLIIEKDHKDERLIIIKLTPKGRDAQNIIITLYNILGLRT